MSNVEEKKKRIKKERNRVEKLIKGYENVEKDTINMLDLTLNNLAYLRVKIEDLGEHVLVHGVTEEYKNGANQWGKKMSSEYEAYVQAVKLYQSSMKQMRDFLPKDTAKDVESELAKFIKERRGG